MRRSEHANGRNAEIKERVEAKIRNVPEQNRERAFINAAKSEAMNQTVRRNGNGVRVQLHGGSRRRALRRPPLYLAVPINPRVMRQTWSTCDFIGSKSRTTNHCWG